MRIYVMSVLVDDQAKALDFYTEKLGFIVKHDIPLGDHRWLTVVSKEAPEGTELLLEPSEHPAAGPFKSALVNDGIPAASFKVDDLKKEFERMRQEARAKDPAFYAKMDAAKRARQTVRS